MCDDEITIAVVKPALPDDSGVWETSVTCETETKVYEADV